MDNFIKEVGEKSGYNKHKDALLKHLKCKINNKLINLVIAQTSMGKTHCATVAVADACFKEPTRKFVAVSIKHGNALDIDLLESLNGGYLKGQVLYLKSNYDNIMVDGQIDRIRHFINSLKDDSDISDANEIYASGKSLIEAIKLRVSFSASTASIQNECRFMLEDEMTKRVNDAEKHFRETIRKYVNKYVVRDKSLKKTIDRMLSLKHFDVLADIYPHLKIFDMKVVICTLAKLMKPIDFIVSSYTSLTDSPYIDKDSTVVIDEIDEAYRTLIGEIVEDITSGKNEINCFNAVQAITKGVNGRKFYELTRNEENVQEAQKEFGNIISATQKISNFLYEGSEYDISNYRIVDCTNEKGGKLFYSDANGQNINVQYLGDDNGKIKYRIIRSNHSIEIYIDNSEEGFNLDTFLNTIIAIYEEMKKSIFFLANQYYEENKTDHLDWTKKTALTTVLNYLISNNDAAISYSDALYNEFLSCYSTGNLEKSEILSNSFIVYELKPHNEIKEELSFNVIECYNTPEKELCKIINKAGNTVGMSATAEIKSITCNFNWDAICEYLGIEYSDIADVPDSLLKFKSSLEYMTNKHKIITTIIPEGGTNKTDILKNINLLIRQIKTLAKSEKFISLYSPNIIELNNFIETTIRNTQDSPFERERGLSALLALLTCMCERSGMTGMFFFNNSINDENEEDIKVKILFYVKMLNEKVLPKDKQIGYCVLKKLKTNTLDIETENLFFANGNFIERSTYLYFTTYGSFSTGGNPFVPITGDMIDFSVDSNDDSKKYYAKIPDANRLKPADMNGRYGGRTDLFKGDIDFIYLEKKTNLCPMVDNNLKGIDFTKNKKFIQTISLYFYNKIVLCGNVSVTKKQIYKQVNDIMKQGVNPKSKNNFLREILLNNGDMEALYILTIIQAVGRLPRNPIGSKYFRIFLQTGKFDDAKQNLALGFSNLEKYGFSKEMSETPIVKSIKEQIDTQKVLYDSLIDEDILEKGDNIRQEALSELSEYRKNPISENTPHIYNYIKNGFFAQYPTMPKSMYDELMNKDIIFKQIGDILYMNNKTGAYKYITDGKTTKQASWMSEYYQSRNGSTFSREELSVDCFNKLLGYDYIHFNENDEYVFTPPFADMVKGDIAEKVTMLIPSLQEAITELTDSDTELFDMKVNNKPLYFDIKNHNHGYVSMSEYMGDKIPKIKSKLRKVKGKAVLFLNMHPSNHFSFNEEYGNIKFIDGFIKEDGSICVEAATIIINYLLYYKGE